MLLLEMRMFFTTPLVKKVRSGSADKNLAGGIISPGEGHAQVQTQVPEAGDHLNNFLPAMQGSGEVTAPPEIHNHLLALLNFE